GSGAYMEGIYFPPYRHYRLRYVSDDKTIKIFEYVKGAVIKGKFKSNFPVKISYEVILTHMKFTYYDSLLTDSAGNFCVVVPYSTTANNFYHFTMHNKVYNVSVTEENIQYGDTIFVRNQQGGIYE
ncbi:MAG: hypothetical protein ACPL28_08575, partial [bacterium]